MIAIFYNQNDNIEFNGQTFYKVTGLYKGDALPSNSFEITEQQYNDWLPYLTEYHYVNAQNRAIGTAVKSANKKNEILSAKLKTSIKIQMQMIWAEAQILSDLGENVDVLNQQYQELIDDYQNI